jgi:hypothetical protein
MQGAFGRAGGAEPQLPLSPANGGRSAFFTTAQVLPRGESGLMFVAGVAPPTRTGSSWTPIVSDETIVLALGASGSEAGRTARAPNDDRATMAGSETRRNCLAG